MASGREYCVKEMKEMKRRKGQEIYGKGLRKCDRGQEKKMCTY